MAALTEILALFDAVPVSGLVATANLREQRARAATAGPYVAEFVGDVDRDTGEGRGDWQVSAEAAEHGVLAMLADDEQSQADAEHLAAEADPAHALAEVALWRAVANEMDVHWIRFQTGDIPYVWTAALAAARAYLAAEAL
jgi:hypothetical protein